MSQSAENDAPDLYVRLGQDVLGPWENLTPPVRQAWRDLADRIKAEDTPIPPEAGNPDA